MSPWRFGEAAAARCGLPPPMRCACDVEVPLVSYRMYSNMMYYGYRQTVEFGDTADVRVRPTAAVARRATDCWAHRCN